MKNQTTLAAFAALTCFASSAQAQNCSQSTDPLTITPGSIACVTAMPQNHVDSSYIRRYDVASNCGSMTGMLVTGASFGIENAVGGTGVQPANVRIYTIAPADMLLFANLTMLHDESIMITDQMAAIMSVQFSAPVSVPAGVDVVIELFTPNGTGAANNVFFIGSNAGGQSAPSYLAAAGCGTPEPTDLANLGMGFPNMHIILDLESNTAGIANSYCTPAVVNSSGAPAIMTAIGSRTVADNNVTLVASSMPANTFGFFLTSQTQGLVMNPGGSLGHLCLGGAIGRYVGAGQITNSGATGTITLVLDLTATPSPTGLVSISAGETYNFQSWFRDALPGGPSSSNFTDGAEIVFQ